MSFASFPVEQLGLTAEQERQCARARISTASDILLVSKSDLARKFGRGIEADRTAQGLIDATNRALMPKAKRASEMQPPDEVRIEGTPFACRVGEITEIVGESAAGKSHLTLALSLAAQLPALSTAPGSVLVLTSERPIATTRLMEMGSAMLARHPHGDNPTLDSILDNVETSPVADADALEHCLSFFLPPLLASRMQTEGSALMGDNLTPKTLQPADAEAVDGVNGTQGRKKTKPPVRLLILDSLAALLRSETSLSGGGLVARSRRLCALSDRLKALALEYSLAVVVVNQVSDVFVGEQRAGPEMLYAAQARHFNGQSAGGRKEAALGIVWANCVNTRIMIARTGRRKLVTVADLEGGEEKGRKRRRTDTPPRRTEGQGQQLERRMGEEGRVGEPVGTELSDEPSLIRRIHQVFSAHGPPASADFILARSGVHVLRNSYRVSDLGPALRRRAARASHNPDETQVATPETQPEEGGGEYGLGDLPEDFWEDDMAVGVVD